MYTDTPYSCHTLNFVMLLSLHYWRIDVYGSMWCPYQSNWKQLYHRWTIQNQIHWLSFHIDFVIGSNIYFAMKMLCLRYVNHFVCLPFFLHKNTFFYLLKLWCWYHWIRYFVVVSIYIFSGSNHHRSSSALRVAINVWWCVQLTIKQ